RGHGSIRILSSEPDGPERGAGMGGSLRRGAVRQVVRGTRRQGGQARLSGEAQATLSGSLMASCPMLGSWHLPKCVRDPPAGRAAEFARCRTAGRGASKGKFIPRTVARGIDVGCRSPLPAFQAIIGHELT